MRGFAAAAYQGNGPHNDLDTLRAFAVAGKDGGSDHLQAFRKMRAYVAAGNGTREGSESNLPKVKAVAAMGFGFELGVVKDASERGYPHVLISFLYDKEGNFFEDRLQYWPTSILGDSGAFTVWTKGETVDLAAYIRWCQAYRSKREDFLAITLDVIPGQLDGGAPTRAEQESAVAQSIENSDAMRAEGVRIMEVFHWHEPIEQLRVLLERRQPGEVVGIGGLAGGGSIVKKREFIDSVFFGKGGVRDWCGGWEKTPPIHGLGVSPDSPLANRVPWWSIDSSSWASPAKFGRHVDSRGKRGGKDSRIGNKQVRELYLTRILEGWNRKEIAYTKVWAERGVRFLP